jgi:hypothetical protein
VWLFPGELTQAECCSRICGIGGRIAVWDDQGRTTRAIEGDWRKRVPLLTGGILCAVGCGPCLLREAVAIIDVQPGAACVRDRRRRFVDNTDCGSKPDHAVGDPRPAAVTFVTTEHFTLQGARAQTVSESTMRASVFLGAVSGGLIALGLVATATKTGVAFYSFGLILLPMLTFVGLATFHRVLQTGTEDLAYARRIAQLRDYYLKHAPELAGYLVNPAEALPAPGRGIGLWQQFVTLAGMVAVVTAVLAGSAGGLLAAVASGHSLVAALAVGVVVAAAALTGLMRYQNSAWIRSSTMALSPGAGAGPH